MRRLLNATYVRDVFTVANSLGYQPCIPNKSVVDLKQGFLLVLVMLFVNKFRNYSIIHRIFNDKASFF